MLHSLQDLERCTIDATDGDVGHVKDALFDDHAWVIRYLVVETGSWLASRKVLISPISVRAPDWAAHKLPVAITRTQVEHSPDIDTERPVSRQHETEYLGYYGYPAYWGGTGLWGGSMLPFSLHPPFAGVPGGPAERELAVAQGQEADAQRHRDDDPHLRSIRAVIGYHLHATDGEVGHVDGFLFDDETWAIHHLAVNTSNWWVGHRVLIVPRWIEGIHESDRTVTVDRSRAAVKAAPLYDAVATPDT